MFNEFTRLEDLVHKSNEKMMSLASNGNGSTKEAYYRVKAREQFRRVKLGTVAERIIQQDLALTAFYLLMAESE